MQPGRVLVTSAPPVATRPAANLSSTGLSVALRPASPPKRQLNPMSSPNTPRRARAHRSPAPPTTQAAVLSMFSNVENHDPHWLEAKQPASITVRWCDTASFPLQYPPP